MPVLRTRRFHNDTEVIDLYKSHILSFIEYRTAAVAHAATSVLASVDAIQTRLLRSLGITDLEALMHFRLAPLCTRRDIAILGMIHRCVLREGPACLWKFFVVEHREPPPRCPRRHCRHLIDPCGLRWPDYALRSAFGGARLYNLLPDYIAAA